MKTTPIPLCFPQPLLVPRVGIPQEERPSGGARWREGRRNVKRTGGLACSLVVCICLRGIAAKMGVIILSGEKLAGGIAYRNLVQLTLPKCAWVH